MNKKKLSPQEQMRIEADFIREEAKRTAADKEEKRQKRRFIFVEVKSAILDFPFVLLWFSTGVSVGMIMFDVLVTELLPLNMIHVAFWIIAASLAIWRLKRIAERR